QALGEGAVGSEDSHDLPVRAMAAEARPAGRAAPAGVVDLADDPPAGEVGGPVGDLSDELVAGDAGETHVAGEYLEIGGADSGEADAHDSLVGPDCRRRPVVDAAQGGAV